MHEATPQTPPPQLSFAFGRLHTEPQALQCAGVALRLVSQPLAAMPSQLPNPGLHAPSAHEPVTQLAPALANPQTVPHVPQLNGSVFRLISQPSTAFALQFPYPGKQAIEHVLALQLAVPLVALQASPQPPQLWTLVAVLISQPLAYWPSQSAYGALQPTTAQLWPMQLGVPFCTAHTFPQEPQLLTLLRNAISQPSEGFALQLPYPAAQLIPHEPARQKADPFVELHARPQPPQCAALTLVSTSHPLAARPSQLP